MKKLSIIFLLAGFFGTSSCGQKTGSISDQILSFGEGGQIKMLYDRRQRPPSVYLDGKVFIVFNAGREPGAPAQSPTLPMAVTYDPDTREFSEKTASATGGTSG